MNIKLNNITKALAKFDRVIQQKSSLPVLQCLLIETIGNNQVQFTGSDLETEIQITVPAEVKEAGKTCIQFKTLKAFAALNTDFSIKTLSSDKARLKGASQSTVNTLPAENFPECRTVSDEDLTLPPGFLTHLDDVLVCASKDPVEPRYYLRGVLFDFQPGQLTLSASNGHQLATTTLKITHTDNKKIILPVVACESIIKNFADSESLLQIAFNDHHLKISIPGNQLISKLIDASYPDFSKVFELDRPNHYQIEAEHLKNAIKAAEITINTQIRGMRFKVEAGQLSVQSANAQAEESEITLPVQSSSDFEYALNSSYMFNILGKLTDSLTANTDAALGNTIFKSINTDTTYLIMHMKI